MVKYKESDSESESEGASHASEPRFRVRVCMQRFYPSSDVRARAYVCVSPRRRVRWLQRRLRRLFALPRLRLLSRGHLLPPQEPLALLQPDDPVEVVPADAEPDDITAPRDVVDSLDEVPVSSVEKPQRSPSPVNPDELPETKRQALMMLEQFCASPATESVPRTRRRRVRRRRRAPPSASMDAGAGTDAVMDAGAGTDAVMDAGAGTDTVMDLSAGTDAVMDAGAGTDAVMDAGAGTDAVMDAGAGTDAVMDAGAGTDTVMDLSAGTDAVMESRAVAGTNAVMDAGVGLGAGTGADVEPTPAPVCRDPVPMVLRNELQPRAPRVVRPLPDRMTDTSPTEVVMG